jgi:hypothetical protein
MDAPNAIEVERALVRDSVSGVVNNIEGLHARK